MKTAFKRRLNSGQTAAPEKAEKSEKCTFRFAKLYFWFWRLYKQQLEEVLAENEKLRRRYKEAERHNEDIQAELERLQRKAKTSSNDTEDLQDDLEDAKRKVKNLTLENAGLQRKISEYKAALEAAQGK